jgi:opacity protein-like surface antigen
MTTGRKVIDMRRLLRIHTTWFIAAIACIAVLTTNAGAQNVTLTEPEGRAGAFSILLFTYNPSTNWSGQGGSRMDLDAAWGAGFGFGYHFSDHFQLNGIVSWGDRDYTARIVNTDGSTSEYDTTLDSTTLSLNGAYYLLKGDITPFVSGGVGLTNVDTNIPAGVATTECWWDPWYGNVCSVDIPTKDETFLSYTVGFGVSFDISPRYRLQTSYNRMWLDVRRAPDMPDFEVWKLDLIFRIP